MSGGGNDRGAGTAFAAAPISRPLEVAAIGVSSGRTCGVRDHAGLLAEALSKENVSCSLHWLWRTEGSLGSARAQLAGWTRELATDLERTRPDAVLWHYSVFEYGYRGFPLFVRPVLEVLRGLSIPLVTVLHEYAYWRLPEYAYPRRRDLVRGRAWTLTQRAVLVNVMRASAAVVVMGGFRAEWLTSRVWLPTRRAVVTPVFSNLPPPAGRPDTAGRDPVVGLFGYAGAYHRAPLVLEAMQLLERRGVRAELILLGAPGLASGEGDTWMQAARAVGVARPPSFSGFLSAQDLSDALAACDVLLFIEGPGPTPVKTTLAASLASGTAVVALDGPHTWPELIQSEAARVVAPAADVLADALADLLTDRDRREALAARGLAFAKRNMAVERNADTIARLLEDLVSRTPS